MHRKSRYPYNLQIKRTSRSAQYLLEAGSKPPEVRLFNGAIGSAYHWLYGSFMAYKDELSLLMGQNIQDYATRLQVKLGNKDQTIETQRKTIEKLIKENEELKNYTLP